MILNDSASSLISKKVRQLSAPQTVPDILCFYQTKPYQTKPNLEINSIIQEI
jgi:hypothetical protein